LAPGVVTAVGSESGGIEPGDKVMSARGAGFDVRFAGSAVKVICRGDPIATCTTEARRFAQRLT
jgi:hypothetical protein